MSRSTSQGGSRAFCRGSRGSSTILSFPLHLSSGHGSESRGGASTDPHSPRLVARRSDGGGPVLRCPPGTVPNAGASVPREDSCGAPLSNRGPELWLLHEDCMAPLDCATAGPRPLPVLVRHPSGDEDRDGLRHLLPPGPPSPSALSLAVRQCPKGPG